MRRYNRDMLMYSSSVRIYLITIIYIRLLYFSLMKVTVGVGLG